MRKRKSTNIECFLSKNRRKSVFHSRVIWRPVARGQRIRLSVKMKTKTNPKCSLAAEIAFPNNFHVKRFAFVCLWLVADTLLTLWRIDNYAYPWIRNSTFFRRWRSPHAPCEWTSYQTNLECLSMQLSLCQPTCIAFNIIFYRKWLSRLILMST